MPWGRLDDGLYDHPKVEQLPRRLRNSCVGLWARAISWSNRYLTDGRVTMERLAKLDGSQAEVDALVCVGMLERDGDGVLIHDFAEYNETADAWRARRGRMHELAKRGGRASGEARRSTAAVKRDGEPQRSSAAVNRTAKRRGLNSESESEEESERRVNETVEVTPGARPDGLVDPVADEALPW